MSPKWYLFLNSAFNRFSVQTFPMARCGFCTAQPRMNSAKFGFLISQHHIRIRSPEHRGFALLTNSFVLGSQVSAYPILRVSGRPSPMHIRVYYSAKNKTGRLEKQAVCSYMNERWSYRTSWLATELIRPRANDLNNSPRTKVVFVMLFCFEWHGRKISIWILVDTPCRFIRLLCVSKWPIVL